MTRELIVGRFDHKSVHQLQSFSFYKTSWTDKDLHGWNVLLIPLFVIATWIAEKILGARNYHYQVTKCLFHLSPVQFSLEMSKLQRTNLPCNVPHTCMSLPVAGAVLMNDGRVRTSTPYRISDLLLLVRKNDSSPESSSASRGPKGNSTITTARAKGTMNRRQKK